MFDTNYYGTEGKIPVSEGAEPRPDLCHQCARCCRSATTFNNHATLLKMAEAGEKEAVEFLSVFHPYESLEAARQVDPAQVDRVLKELASQGKGTIDEDVTFYYCNYVTPTGQCSIYERRPACCRRAPDNGWAMMPPGCGFEGWQFEQREKQMQMVRTLKTQAYMLEQLSEDGINHPTRPETTLADLKATVEEKIRPWKRFGADVW